MRPTRIDLNRAEAFLEITWQDGAICRYPLSHLREACPCVECRGGHEYMGNQFAPDNILTLTPARSKVGPIPLISVRASD
ncbi:MAG: gamma-butyrobetaine hydroxylase-like domain-containing protein, partial [Chloroflexota bacterium]